MGEQEGKPQPIYNRLFQVNCRQVPNDIRLCSNETQKEKKKKNTHSGMILVQKLVVSVCALQGLHAGTFSSDGKGACYPASTSNNVDVSHMEDRVSNVNGKRTSSLHSQLKPTIEQYRKPQTAPNRHRPQIETPCFW